MLKQRHKVLEYNYKYFHHFVVQVGTKMGDWEYFYYMNLVLYYKCVYRPALLRRGLFFEREIGESEMDNDSDIIYFIREREGMSII